MLTTCYFAFPKCKLSSFPPTHAIHQNDWYIQKVLQMIFNTPLTNDTLVLFKVHSLELHTLIPILLFTFQNSLQSLFRIATSCLIIFCLGLSRSPPTHPRLFLFLSPKKATGSWQAWVMWYLTPPPPKKNSAWKMYWPYSIQAHSIMLHC